MNDVCFDSAIHVVNYSRQNVKTEQVTMIQNVRVKDKVRKYGQMKGKPKVP